MRKIAGGGGKFFRFFQTIIIVDKPMIILHDNFYMAENYLSS